MAFVHQRPAVTLLNVIVIQANPVAQAYGFVVSSGNKLFKFRLAQRITIQNLSIGFGRGIAGKNPVDVAVILEEDSGIGQLSASAQYINQLAMQIDLDRKSVVS